MTANGGQSAPKNRPKEDGVQTCDPSRWKITKERKNERKNQPKPEEKKMTLFPRHEESDDATREKAMKKGWKR